MAEDDFLKQFRCIADFEQYAKKHLPQYAYDFYAAAATRQFTLRRNQEIFNRLLIIPRMLRDVSNVDLSCGLVNKSFPLSIPIGISPSAYHGMAHPDGERETAKGCAKAGGMFILSQGTSAPLEEVAIAEPKGPRWINVFFANDRNVTFDIIRRAERAGFSALVLSVDCPALGKRNNDLSEGYQSLLLTKNVWGGQFPPGEQLKCFAASNVTWEEVKRLRDVTRLPLIIKGILHPDDARNAVECGAVAVIVSNHGGRQLDGTPSALEVLPSIVRAVRGKCEVYMDGGVRSGYDVFKAIALGAKAVFVGRPALWGLSAKGKEGVEHVLNILKVELENAMILSGCSKLEDITEELIVKEDHFLSRL